MNGETMAATNQQNLAHIEGGKKGLTETTQF